MNTDPHILAMIARSGLTEDDLLGFIEGDLPADRAAAVVRTLADHPELSAMIVGMRSDRSSLGHELEFAAAEPDPAYLDAVVHQGVTGEIDPEFAARFEAIGRTVNGGAIPRMRPTRVIRVSRFRFPVRAAGTLLAACVAIAFFGAIWAAWPTTPNASTPPAIADGAAASPIEAESAFDREPGIAEATPAIADAGND
ncbi:MAG: hypothetical protein AAF235_09300, partial [Planctomycetota bacterium]